MLERRMRNGDDLKALVHGRNQRFHSSGVPLPFPFKSTGACQVRVEEGRGRVVSDLELASPGCPDKSHVLEPSPLPHNHFLAHLILLKAPGNGCCLSPL